ncbi:cold shock domain-containing protein [Saccharopolyspora taberi]|uniref:CSD domain-containing protein n=1 Tax=Saccharopolyspora taberi TaxID=60895 RepID=A0ABN3VCD5_9PSEU
MKKDVHYNGQVEEWNRSEGWGVIRIENETQRIWGHFSHIDADANDFRSLEPGEHVVLTVEPAEQDGYHWRATWIKKGT